MKIDKIKLRMGESVIRRRREIPYRIPEGVIATWEFLFEELVSAKKPEDVGISFKEELEELGTLFERYRSLVNEFASESEIKHQIEKLEAWKPLVKITMADYVDKFFKPKIEKKRFEREDMGGKEIKPAVPYYPYHREVPVKNRVEEIIKESKTPPSPEKKTVTVKPAEEAYTDLSKYSEFKVIPKTKEKEKTMGATVMDMLRKETEKIDFVRREDFEKKLNELVEKIEQMDLKFAAEEVSEDLYKSTNEDLIKNLIKVLDKGREMRWISKKRYKKMKVMCEGK